MGNNIKHKTTLFRSLIISASLATVALLAVLASILYVGTMTPMEQLAKDEALDNVKQNLNLQLRSKEDSVLSIAAALSRDQQVRKALLNDDRDAAVSSLNNLTEDFASITDYRMIRAQVINSDGIIIARSWDLDFFGEPAPHPMVATTMETHTASASFSLGNAGIGIIGFAPVIENNQLIGVISVTQGVGSVVRALKEDHLDWVLLLNKQSILERFSGRYPVTLAQLPSINEDYLLAHPDWFDRSLAERLSTELSDTATEEAMTTHLDSQLLFEFPTYDRSGSYIGKSLMLKDDTEIASRLDGVQSATYLLIATTLLIVTCVVALLLWLVRHRVLLPINHIISVINQTVATGRFSKRVHVSRQDELGLMAQNLNTLLANIERALNESNRVMGELAVGNFEQRIEGQYQGDLLTMKQGINAAALELKEARVKVLQASEAKGQFLANMSHEIRTPINGVIGMLSLLETTPLSTEQAEQVHLATRSAELLLGLVNDILDFSKIEAGKMSIESEPVHLKELTHTLEHLFQHTAKHKQIQLIQHYDKHLSDWIEGDSLRIRQVLNNLLSNAIKFTDQGKVTLDITLSEDGKRIGFSVQDTGIGISPEAQQRLFSSFSQADSSTSRKYGGTGLGLMISKELIELMHGRLWLDSEIGKGSTFSFEIPYKPCAPAESTKDTRQTFAQHSDRKVLLVEDNLVNQKLAMKLLEKFNIDATLAQNGEEALQQLESNVFDLILMDCQMPIMDGYEATKIIRQRDIMTPIAALTANASEEDKKMCLSCGMNDFLSKPYNIEKMAQLLQRWL